MSSDINPFRLKRKAERYSAGRATRKHVKSGWGVKSIEPCGETETVCIAVSAPSRLYLTEHFIPTHNTGGYSRSNISWLAFLMLAEELLNHQLELFQDQVLKPLCWLNFRSIDYTIKPQSLLPKDEGPQQGQPGQPGQPQPGQQQQGSGLQPYTGPRGGHGMIDQAGHVRYGSGTQMSLDTADTIRQSMERTVAASESRLERIAERIERCMAEKRDLSLANVLDQRDQRLDRQAEQSDRRFERTLRQVEFVTQLSLASRGEQKAPVVNVAPAQVNAPVTVNLPPTPAEQPRTRTVQRDERGLIKTITETPHAGT